MHCLELYFLNSNNCKIIELQDISQYDPDVDIEEPVLKVQVPGQCCPVYPIFKVKGKTFLTSTSLSITTSGLSNLPDGLYTFTYSVCPNDEVFTEQKYLRDCQTRNLVMTKLSKYIITSCGSDIMNCFGKVTTESVISDMKDLLLILDLAQIDAKNFNYSDAVSKLQYVNRRINNL